MGKQICALSEMSMERLVNDGSEKSIRDRVAELEALDSFLICRSGTFLSEFQTILEAPVLRLIRDPRDMIVSGYYSHLYSHENVEKNTLHQYWKLSEVRSTLMSMDKSSGLVQEILYFQRMFNCMENWNKTTPGQLDIKYEELLEGPDTLVKQLKRLGVCPKYMTKQIVEEAYARSEFSKVTGGRSNGEEDPLSHYRNGQAGNWREHFEPVHIDLIKKVAGSLLIELGYEQDRNWR